MTLNRWASTVVLGLPWARGRKVVPVLVTTLVGWSLLLRLAWGAHVGRVGLLPLIVASGVLWLVSLSGAFVRSERGPTARWAVLFVLLQLTGGALVYQLVPKAFVISGASMSPTLRHGDLILVSPHWGRSVAAGDLVVVDRAGLAMAKRVIVVGPATVGVRRGTVYVNGQRLREPYLPQRHERPDCADTTLGEGELYVLGDNRFASVDSCEWGGVQLDALAGFVVHVGF